MKIRIVSFIVTFFIFSCNQLGQQKDISKVCEKSELFGDVSICLPEIDGMKECYENPIVKSKASNSYTDAKSGKILAVYLNNNTYKQVDKLSELKFDDYFTVYVVDKLKGVTSDYSLLNKLSDAFENNYVKDNWENVKKNIEKNYDYFSIGRPVLLDSYVPSKDIRSFVFLSKVQSNDDEYISIVILNLILVKDRIIWASYYKDYKNQESIISAKSKNDYMTLLVKEENK